MYFIMLRAPHIQYYGSFHRFDDLNNIFIVENMISPHAHWLMFGAGSPDKSIPESWNLDKKILAIFHLSSLMMVRWILLQKSSTVHLTKNDLSAAPEWCHTNLEVNFLLSIGRLKNDRLFIVGELALGLRVDSNLQRVWKLITKFLTDIFLQLDINSYQLEILPHLLKQTVVVPLVMCGDRDTMGDLGVKNVKKGALEGIWV